MGKRRKNSRQARTVTGTAVTILVALTALVHELSPLLHR